LSVEGVDVVSRLQESAADFQAFVLDR